jgi:hypothetical protein
MESVCHWSIWNSEALHESDLGLLLLEYQSRSSSSTSTGCRLNPGEFTSRDGFNFCVVQAFELSVINVVCPEEREAFDSDSEAECFAGRMRVTQWLAVFIS